MSEKGSLWWKITRRKTLETDVLQTPLRRCLTTIDLTLFGISQMASSIFVLTGIAMRNKSGPGAVLSYLFAGVAALLGALCYAEFGARVPKAGSAYSYTYVVLGEFFAFIIGWNVVLEYLIFAAASGRSIGGTVDSILGGRIHNWTDATLGVWSIGVAETSPDFIAFFIILLTSLIIAILGTRESVSMNNLFGVANVLIVLFTGILAFCYSNTKEYTDGFLPFGFAGVLKGAATLFYAYIGFDAISIVSEEAINPNDSVPKASVLSVVVVTGLNIFTTAGLSLLVPYYTLSQTATFSNAFLQRGVTWASYVVSVLTLFAITSTLIATLFALPRTVYAMSSDGLFFSVFSRVSDRTQTPAISVTVFGIIAAILGLLVSLEALADFVSIGTLVAYTFVAGAVIVLRYAPTTSHSFAMKPEQLDEDYAPVLGETAAEDSAEDKGKGSAGKSNDKIPHRYSYADFGKLKRHFVDVPVISGAGPGKMATLATVLMAAFMFAWCGVVIYTKDLLLEGVWWSVLLFVVSTLGVVGCYSVLIMHVQNDAFLTFTMPFVPLLPSLSMWANIAMMMYLSWLTWVRLAIWIVVGMIIYFAYGIHHSAENRHIPKYERLVSVSKDITDAAVDNSHRLSFEKQQPASKMAHKADDSESEADDSDSDAQNEETIKENAEKKTS